MNLYFISRRSKGILYILEAAISSIVLILILFSILSLTIPNIKVEDYDKYYSMLKSLDESGVLNELIKNPNAFKYYFKDCFVMIKDENSTIYAESIPRENLITINYFYINKNGKYYLIRLFCM